MAFPTTGMHVTVGYAGSLTNRDASQSLMGLLTGSQTFDAAGTTGIIAPPIREGGAGAPVFEVWAPVASFISVGPSGVASAAGTKRHFVAAGVFKQVFAEPGDVLDWKTA